MKMNRQDIQVWTNVYKSFKEVIEELLYPSTCVLCGKLEASGLCDRCKKKNPRIREPRCMCCGKPIQKEEEELCSDCMIQKKSFVQGRSLWLHRKEVKQSIYLFKYKNRRIYADKYAELLVKQYEDVLKQWKPQCIIPVPVHPRRRRMRGYNQAEVLGRALRCQIEQRMGVQLPIVVGSVCRKKQTIYQKKLDNRQRRKNISGAFQVQVGYSFPNTVLVVDDIYTTGATLQELSKVLVKAGVENVYFLTISIGQGV